MVAVDDAGLYELDLTLVAVVAVAAAVTVGVVSVDCVCRGEGGAGGRRGGRGRGRDDGCVGVGGGRGVGGEIPAVATGDASAVAAGIPLVVVAATVASCCRRCRHRRAHGISAGDDGAVVQLGDAVTAVVVVDKAGKEEEEKTLFSLSTFLLSHTADTDTRDISAKP